MSIKQAKDHYRLALQALVAPGDIHSRVNAAIGSHIFHLDANLDLPPSAQAFHSALYSDLGLEDNHPANVRAKIDAMSEMEVEKIAQHILKAYEELLSAHKGD